MPLLQTWTLVLVALVLSFLGSWNRPDIMSSSETPTSQGRTLQTLPFEIRAAIFNYVIGPSTFKLERDYDRLYRTAALDRTAISLRFTCRQTGVETLALHASHITLELAYGARPHDLPIYVQTDYLPHIQHLIVTESVFEELDLNVFPNLQRLELRSYAFSFRTHNMPFDGGAAVLRGDIDQPCKQLMSSRRRPQTQRNWLRYAIKRSERKFSITQTAVLNLLPHCPCGMRQTRFVGSHGPVYFYEVIDRP